MTPVDDIQTLAARHDHFGLARVIDNMPGQIEYALSDPAFPGFALRAPRKVVVAGMGGSALPVDVLLGVFAGRFAAPVEVCRHYTYAGADADTLAVASSFSGNTEETIECFEGMLDQGAQGVVLTAGGRLAELARERDLPMVLVPAEREGEGFQPRCATGYVVTYLARILAAAGVLDRPEQVLQPLPAFLRELSLRAQGEEVARWIGDRIPVFYTDEQHLASVARITKIKINEHAKRAAFFNALPEANHNETIGYTAPFGPFAVLYMHDPASHPRILRRFEVMDEVFTDADHMDFRMWTMPGDTPAEKVFACGVFGEWMAYTCALLAGIDPTPVPLVESFKKKLG